MKFVNPDADLAAVQASGLKITAIKQQEKRKDRYSVFVNDIYAFSLSETALLQAQIATGQELDKPQLKAFKQLSADDKAYGNALRYSAMRLRSEWEMQQYFRRKEVAAPTAETIMIKLRELRLLDDAQFARSWVANRRILKPTSRRRLAQELQQKRIASSIIDEVLATDRYETDELAVLRGLAERKAQRYPDKTKFMQYLARQGYQYNDIKVVLEEDREKASYDDN